MTSPKWINLMSPSRVVYIRSTFEASSVGFGPHQGRNKIVTHFLRQIMNFDEAIKTVIDSVADEVAIWKKSGL